MSCYKELVDQGQYSQVISLNLTHENPASSQELLGVSQTYIDLLVVYEESIHYVKRFPLQCPLLRVVAYQEYLVAINDRQDVLLLAYESEQLLVRTEMSLLSFFQLDGDLKNEYYHLGHLLKVSHDFIFVGAPCNYMVALSYSASYNTFILENKFTFDGYLADVEYYPAMKSTYILSQRENTVVVVEQEGEKEAREQMIPISSKDQVEIAQ